MATRVVVFNEAIHPDYPPGGWQLCFQWVRYMKENGDTQDGYRFIWRRPAGDLQAARGQARIPSLAQAGTLFEMARAAGWGNHDGG